MKLSRKDTDIYLMRAGATTRIIDIHTLKTGHPKFNGVHHALVKEAARSSDMMAERGYVVANLLVHPLFCSLSWEKPENAMDDQIHNYPDFKSAFQAQQSDPYFQYPAYIQRVELALRITTFPTFVFTVFEHRHIIERWLRTLLLRAPVVMLNTFHGDHTTPIPVFNGDPAEPWRDLAAILAGLEVNVLPIMGELDYSSEGKVCSVKDEGSGGEEFFARHGCVGEVWSSLSDLKDAFGFQALAAVSDHTYPGFIYRPLDFEAFVRDLAQRSGAELPSFDDLV